MDKNWIVVDLDGTLCDCSHRVHLAQSKQWDEFYSGISQDKVNPEVKFFLELASANGYEILACTGRNEQSRSETMKWIESNGLAVIIDQVLMRPNGNKGQDTEVKLQLIDEFFAGREKALENVLLVLDDRDRVVQAFRDAGFVCWQVASGSY